MPVPPRFTRRERSVLIGGSIVAALALLAVVGFGVVIMYFALLGFNDGASYRRRHPIPDVTEVVKVVDGDTIVVAGTGEELSVRLLGIDTPETKDPRKPVQCFGAEASARTAELLPPGTQVRLVRDVEERDVYDRLLAYVYRVDDGLFVNLDLARQGYADLLTYSPNVAHAGELGDAVSAARREELGLWKACGGPGRPAS